MYVLLCVTLCFTQPRDPSKDPTVIEAENLARRADIQQLYKHEYEQAVVELKQKVRVSIRYNGHVASYACLHCLAPWQV